MGSPQVLAACVQPWGRWVWLDTWRPTYWQYAPVESGNFINNTTQSDPSLSHSCDDPSAAPPHRLTVRRMAATQMVVPDPLHSISLPCGSNTKHQRQSHSVLPASALCNPTSKAGRTLITTLHNQPSMSLQTTYQVLPHLVDCGPSHPCHSIWDAACCSTTHPRLSLSEESLSSHPLPHTASQLVLRMVLHLHRSSR